MTTYKKILFPIDLSPRSAKIFPHVKAMAEQFGAEIHVVHVAKISEYYREDECEPNLKICEPGQTINQAVNDFVKEHLSILPDPKIVVLSGETIEQLLDYIKESGIDMIIMATRGRSPLGKMVFGSVAGGIVREINIPVLFVRPDVDKSLE